MTLLLVVGGTAPFPLKNNNVHVCSLVEVLAVKTRRLFDKAFLSDFSCKAMLYLLNKSC